MRTLVIDTASEACSVASFDADRLIGHDHRLIGRGHAEALLPMVAALPSGGRADRILVGCGPGSFTGVRVGIAAARALGIGWQVPVNGFGTLALVAAGCADGGPLLVVMEGGHGEWFVQRFDHNGMALGDPLSMPPDDAVRDPTDRVVGSRAAEFCALRGFGTAVPALPDARHGLLLPVANSGGFPKPYYGRAPDAVVKRG